jgi:hypothetical protein
MNENAKNVAIMVRGAYDLQKLRMQMGLRLVGNFRAKLKVMPEIGSNPKTDSVPTSASNPTQTSAPKAKKKAVRRSEPESDSEPKVPSETDDAEITEEGKKVIEVLRASYKRLTDGVARNRTLPTQKGFHGDEIISTYVELQLVDRYIDMEKMEAKTFRMLTTSLEEIPIYNEYLKDVIGVGPAMAGVIIGWFDPHKARHVSSFWKYSGLDVGPDGRGRSRRQEHLVEREYKDKNGELKTRMSITYEPFVKTKLMGVLAGSFIRTGSSWRLTYDDYKNRLLSDDRKIKVGVDEWKKLRKAGEDVSDHWTPGRINDAAKRYMIKMFLADLWVRWRTLEGLPVTKPYAEAKLGHRPHKAA